MAEAVMRLGGALVDLWDGSEPLWVNQPPCPDFPSELQAFDENGPIEAIHARYAAVVRSIQSPAAFEVETMQRRLDELAEAEELQELDVDPAAFERAIARAEGGADANDPVTLDHWSAVWHECELRKGLPEAAEARLTLVADRFLEISISGILATFARPLGGGAIEPLPKELWEIDSALPRMASCGINMDAPLQSEAPITHYIFVDEVGLCSELTRAKVARAKPALPPRSPSQIQETKEELSAWLLEFCETHDAADYAKEDVEREAQKRFGRTISGRGFTEVWKMVMPLVPSGWSKPGPKAGKASTRIKRRD
jgi:hypothetical protein